MSFLRTTATPSLRAAMASANTSTWTRSLASSSVCAFPSQGKPEDDSGMDHGPSEQATPDGANQEDIAHSDAAYDKRSTRPDEEGAKIDKEKPGTNMDNSAASGKASDLADKGTSSTVGKK